MRVVVVEPPAPVVAWTDIDAHLKLDGDGDQQAEVEAMIAAATANIDGPEGWLGRAIGPQTLEVRLEPFTEQSLILPYPPVIEIVAIEYLDTDNQVQTLAEDAYELMGRCVVPAFGVNWPTMLPRREALRVRYRAGYPELPAPIRAAILLMVGDLYRNRETVATGVSSPSVIPMSTTVTRLLGPFRVWA